MEKGGSWLLVRLSGGLVGKALLKTKFYSVYLFTNRATTSNVILFNRKHFYLKKSRLDERRGNFLIRGKCMYAKKIERYG
jgi:hypothetical protein